MVRAWCGVVLVAATEDMQLEVRDFDLTVDWQHLRMEQGLHEGDVDLLANP